jgi:mono/diheme cytochrome c family protein
MEKQARRQARAALAAIALAAPVSLMLCLAPFVQGHAGKGAEMSRCWGRLAMAGAIAAVIAFPAAAADKAVERGKYLVELGGCVHCHTPGYFLGKPDMARRLGGSDVGFYLPNLGTFYGPNLTPDKETGLGRWSTAEIVTAITTGKRPDGRLLAPIMPWGSFAELAKNDARAIALYLKSLPPVHNRAPGPFGPNETPTSFALKVTPPEAVLAK